MFDAHEKHASNQFFKFHQARNYINITKFIINLIRSAFIRFV